MGLVFKSSIKSQSNSPIKLSGIMQVYFVLFLVAVASAHTTLLKHKANNAPVLNLNHKNVHLTQQVPVVDTVDIVDHRSTQPSTNRLYHRLTPLSTNMLYHRFIPPSTTRLYHRSTHRSRRLYHRLTPLSTNK